MFNHAYRSVGTDIAEALASFGLGMFLSMVLLYILTIVFMEWRANRKEERKDNIHLTFLDLLDERFTSYVNGVEQVLTDRDIKQVLRIQTIQREHQIEMRDALGHITTTINDVFQQQLKLTAPIQIIAPVQRKSRVAQIPSPVEPTVKKTDPRDLPLNVLNFEE